MFRFEVVSSLWVLLVKFRMHLQSAPCVLHAELLDLITLIIAGLIKTRSHEVSFIYNCSLFLIAYLASSKLCSDFTVHECGVRNLVSIKHDFGSSRPGIITECRSLKCSVQQTRVLNWQNFSWRSKFKCSELFRLLVRVQRTIFETAVSKVKARFKTQTGSPKLVITSFGIGRDRSTGWTALRTCCKQFIVLLNTAVKFKACWCCLCLSLVQKLAF